MAARIQPVVVIGAGIGGLVAASLLAARGRAVVVFDRAPGPGGKVREVEVEGVQIGAGPALLTLRPVFEEIFAAAGDRLEARLTLRPESLLGRHAWPGGAALDLPVETEAAAEAIGRFGGPAAERGYRAFRDRARRIHDALDAPLLRARRPSAMALATQAGLRGLLGASPFTSLWDALGEHFPDPRLRQVFARVATYVGSSPLKAPATLMLVAHVEMQGLWAVQGGMVRLAEALDALARRHGAVFRYGAEVQDILVAGGRACGLRLVDGETVEAAAIVLNADPSALGAGRFGQACAGAAERTPVDRRSFSAITWALRATMTGATPAAQTVVHADDPVAEYAELGYRARLPAVPTVTAWAQDRMGDATPPPGPERFLVMVNAPARADLRPLAPDAIARCGATAFDRLRRAGLPLEPRHDAVVATTPGDFDRMFPGSGGALYGPAVHGWQAAFGRPGAKTKVPGLVLAGGGTHPGAGVAMAALSGRSAAMQVIEAGG